MGKHSDYKKCDEIAANDLDAGCRYIVNQQTPRMRRLRDILRRQARRRVNQEYDRRNQND